MAWLLLPQFVALLGGAWAIARRSNRGDITGEGRRRAILLAGVILLAAAGAVGADRRLLSQRSNSVRSGSAARASQGGAEIGVNVAFVEWARRFIPARDSFYMIFPPRWHDESAFRWVIDREWTSTGCSPAI